MNTPNLLTMCSFDTATKCKTSIDSPGKLENLPTSFNKIICQKSVIYLINAAKVVVYKQFRKQASIDFKKVVEVRDNDSTNGSIYIIQILLVNVQICFSLILQYVNSWDNMEQSC